MNDRHDDPLEQPVRTVLGDLVAAAPTPGEEPTIVQPLRRAEPSMRPRRLLLAAAAVMVVGGVAGTLAIVNQSSNRPSVQIDPAAATIELAEAQELLESGTTDPDRADTGTTPPGVPADGQPADGQPADGTGSDPAGDPVLPPDRPRPDPGVPDDSTPITVILSNYTVFDVSMPREVQAGESLLIEWSVETSDGVDVTTARVGGASGWVSWCPFPMIGSRISGTATLGRYRAGCTVPANAPNGKYTVFFQASTLAGASGLPLGTSDVDFEIVAGSSDDAAPTVSAINVPATAQRGDSVTFTWRSTDTSGVEWAIGWLENGGFALNDGTRLVDYGDFTVTRISGDEFDGVYSQTIRFTENSPLGTYTIWFSRLDTIGNRTIEASTARITLTE